jgi:nanoRNase/pAp phosphatase (c-di-AMP/oligoRNAs hydrolase)
MKLVLVGFVMALAGCANTQPAKSQAVSYEQLAAIKLSNRDCVNIDHHINWAETQLRLKGFTNAIPEDLNNDDRQYNATARIIIWSLRIGCANPDRYNK